MHGQKNIRLPRRFSVFSSDEYQISVYIAGKCKLHPTTDHKGPEGRQRYSFTLSFTSALDEGGGWSTQRPGRFIPGKRNSTRCTEGRVRHRAG